MKRRAREAAATFVAWGLVAAAAPWLIALLYLLGRSEDKHWSEKPQCV